MIKQDYKPPKDAPYEVRWILGKSKHLPILQTHDLEYAKSLCPTTDRYVWDRINKKVAFCIAFDTTVIHGGKK